MSALRAGVIAALLVALLVAGPAAAQTSTAPGPGAAGSARPASGPEQSALGAPAPAAGTSNVTAMPNPDPGVQQMNDEARRKVEREGK